VRACDIKQLALIYTTSNNSGQGFQIVDVSMSNHKIQRKTRREPEKGNLTLRDTPFAL